MSRRLGNLMCCFLGNYIWTCFRLIFQSWCLQKFLVRNPLRGGHLSPAPATWHGRDSHNLSAGSNCNARRVKPLQILMLSHLARPSDFPNFYRFPSHSLGFPISLYSMWRSEDSLRFPFLPAAKPAAALQVAFFSSIIITIQLSHNDHMEQNNHDIFICTWLRHHLLIVLAPLSMAFNRAIWLPNLLTQNLVHLTII